MRLYYVSTRANLILETCWYQREMWAWRRVFWLQDTRNWLSWFTIPEHKIMNATMKDGQIGKRLLVHMKLDRKWNCRFPLWIEWFKQGKKMLHARSSNDQRSTSNSKLSQTWPREFGDYSNHPELQNARLSHPGRSICFGFFGTRKPYAPNVQQSACKLEVAVASRAHELIPQAKMSNKPRGLTSWSWW